MYNVYLKNFITLENWERLASFALTSDLVEYCLRTCSGSVYRVVDTTNRKIVFSEGSRGKRISRYLREYIESHTPFLSWKLGLSEEYILKILSEFKEV